MDAATSYSDSMADAGSVADVTVGHVVAGYRSSGSLGRGGMSVVYLAEDTALGRHVALKLLAPELSQDRHFRERFRLESRLAASIDHANVIPVYEAGEADGLLYIAMRYVEGTDLRAPARRRGRARARAWPSSSPPRSPTGSRPRTPEGSSTATSSRRTS